MPSVAVYRLRDRYLIHPICLTTAGVGVACEPYLALAADCSIEEVGSAVLTALDAANVVVRHPTDWKSFGLKRLAAAGVKSELALHRQAHLVMLQANAGHLQAVPHRNGGTRGDDKGFHALTGDTTAIANFGAVALGAGVLKAFLLCRGGANIAFDRGAQKAAPLSN